RPDARAFLDGTRRFAQHITPDPGGSALTSGLGGRPSGFDGSTSAHIWAAHIWAYGPLYALSAALAALASAERFRLAAPVDRACSRGRRARRGRRVLQSAPLRASARVAVPVARGHRRANEQDRDRHRRHRHAL